MHVRFGAILISILAMPVAAQAQTFPGADWQRRTPAEAGINPQLLKTRSTSPSRARSRTRAISSSTTTGPSAASRSATPSVQSRIAAT